MVEGSCGWHREDRGSGPASTSYGALADEIAATFATRLAGLRQQLRSWEMPAAVRALQDEKHAALRALRERLATARHSEREGRRLRAWTRPRPS
jgi:hypothetical protein